LLNVPPLLHAFFLVYVAMSLLLSI